MFLFLNDNKKRGRKASLCVLVSLLCVNQTLNCCGTGYCTSNLAGTQATGAGIDTLRCEPSTTALDTADVGLPGTDWSVCGSGKPEYRRLTLFAADITFSHVSAPPLKGLFFITTLVFYQIHAKIASVFPIFFQIGRAVISVKSVIK